MCCTHYLSHGYNFGSEDEILERLDNSLVIEVREGVIRFLGGY